MTTTWYRDPTTSEDRTAHRGTLGRGRVRTACGRDFPSYGARVDGEPAAEDVCEQCPREATPEDHPARTTAPVQEGRAAAPIRGARARWPVRGGPVGAALAGAVLVVLALALVTYLVWPR